MKFKLNKQQQLAKDAILTGGYHFLNASGGRGKSFTTANIILQLLSDSDPLNKENTVTVVAPSHTARSALEGEIKKQGGNSVITNVVSMTVAAALGKVPDFSEAPDSIRDTNFTMNSEGGALLDNMEKGGTNLLVIEEVSMVSGIEIVMMLNAWEHVQNANDIILFSGDFKQIRPVKAKSPKHLIGTLIADRNLEVHSLDVNERADKGTDIDGYSISVFEEYNGNYEKYNRGVTEYTDEIEFENAFCDAASIDESVTAIAYSNAKVTSYLRLARDSNEFNPEKGDSIRLHESVSVTFKDAVSNTWVTECVANNGDVVPVLDYRKPSPNTDPFELDPPGVYTHPLCKGHKIKYGVITLDIKNPSTVAGATKHITRWVTANIDDAPNAGKDGAYSLLFTRLLEVITKTIDNLQSTIVVTKDICELKPDSDYVNRVVSAIESHDPGFQRIWNTYNEKFNEGSGMCFKMKKKILMARCFYGERSKFSNITTLDALTAHKSQGQSINYVFADLRNIKKGEMQNYTGEKGSGFELAYVACSRAKKELHVLY